MENLLPECQDELKRVKDLLRQIVMRSNLMLPETEEDIKWFDDGIMELSGIEKKKLMRDIIQTLGLNMSLL